MKITSKWRDICKVKTSNTTLQRPAARYDALGKIGGGYGSLVSMFSRFVSRCPWLPKFGWVPNKGALSNLSESLVEYVEVVPAYPGLVPWYPEMDGSSYLLYF